MSPEQAEGRSAILDHRTDIYSLGITLYELATLHPAFPATDRQTLLRQIAADELRSPRKLNPAIPADLQTIVLKATAKEPSERYSSARHFAEDLRRHLNHQPIKARGPSISDRLVRIMRRYPRVSTSLGSLVAAVAVGFAFLLALEKHHTAELESLIEDKKVALVAADRHLQATIAIVNDMVTKLDRERSLFNSDELVRVREELIDAGISALDRLGAVNPDHFQTWSELASAHLTRAQLTWAAGKLEEAEKHFKQAEAILTSIEKRRGTLDGLHSDVLFLEGNYGDFLSQSRIGRRAEGLRRWQRGVLVAEDYVQKNPKNVEAHTKLAILQFNLGNAFMFHRRYGPCIEAYEGSIAAARSVAELSDNQRYARWRANDNVFAFALCNLSMVLSLCPDKALRDPPRAFALAEEALTLTHAGPLERRMFFKAAAYCALAKCENAIEVLQQCLDADPGEPDIYYLLAVSHFQIGELDAATDYLSAAASLPKDREVNPMVAAFASDLLRLSKN